jgi:hypothetical protein
MPSLQPVFKRTSSGNYAVMVLFTVLLVGCASTPPGPTESDRLLGNCEISLTTSRLQRDSCESELASERDAMQALRTETDTQLAICQTERDLFAEKLSGTQQTLSQCRESDVVAN